MMRKSLILLVLLIMSLPNMIWAQNIERLSFAGRIKDPILIDTAKEVELILDNVSLRSVLSIPIEIRNTPKLVLILRGTSHIEAGKTAAIKSRGAALLVRGNGTLNIRGEADGIRSKSLSIEEGNFNLDVGDDALQSDDDLIIRNANINISSVGDAIHSDNHVYIYSGIIEISKSYEGIEGRNIDIFAGDISIVSSDDGINIAGDNLDFSKDALRIYGGFIEVDAAGDGIDSNASVFISGGIVLVQGPAGKDSEGKLNGALDYDNTFQVSGGLLIAVGDSRMSRAPSRESTINSVHYLLRRKQDPKTLIHVEDSKRNSILTFRAKKGFQAFVIASPQLQSGESYSFYLGGKVVAAVDERAGLYTSAVYEAGSLLNTVKITARVLNLRG